MAGGDELILTGSYKGFKSELLYDLSSVDEKEVAKILGAVSDSIELYAYEFAGVDVPKIQAYAKASGEGFNAVLDFLKNNPQGEIKKELEKTITKKELLPVAEGCFLNLLMKSAKVSFRMGDSIAVPSTKPSKEKAEDQLMFVGRFNQWMAIKKLTINAKTEGWEVSALLCGINHTIVNKAFEFIQVEKDDALVSKLSSGKRKSFGNLLAALELLATNLTGDKLKDAYLICKVCENIGYKLYASPEMLVKAYPDVKPPKVKGRKPK